MTKNMMDQITLVVTMVLALVALLSFIELYNDQDCIYEVDQYVFKDGTKITIDWNTYEDSDKYENVRYYKGYINDGTGGATWLMSAEQWYREVWLKGGDNYNQYRKTLSEWRW